MSDLSYFLKKGKKPAFHSVLTRVPRLNRGEFNFRYGWKLGLRRGGEPFSLKQCSALYLFIYIALYAIQREILKGNVNI